MRGNAFICCQRMYGKAAYKLVSQPSFWFLLEDFNTYDEHSFFRLGDILVKRPNMQLGKRKKAHRWGVLALLWKKKVLLKIKSGEICCWDDLKFRPITSYFQNVWKKWHNFAGRSLSLIAVTLYWKGCSVMAPWQVQGEISKFNSGRPSGEIY